MITTRTALIRRIAAALDATPSRISVLLGGCGTGRTTAVHQLRDRIGRGLAQTIDIERIATTPERFFRAVVGPSPFPAMEQAPANARAAFDATLAFLMQAKTDAGEHATFVLDEFLELRTFESFPGLRHVLHELLDGLAVSSNRFVLTSRYTARSLRFLRDRSARFEVIHMPPLTAEDTLAVLGPETARDTHEAEYLARTVVALADGRPSYVQAMGDELAAMHRSGETGSSDPISALSSLFATDGRLSRQCNFCYELRLHRARGYGALKAILEILADEEGLSLTEISHRLHRTPGSTKDYLSWLEDVDLVSARQKRYSFTDPVLRVWVRLHCRPSPATEEERASELHKYALPRLPQPAEPAFAMATTGGGSGIIEID